MDGFSVFEDCGSSDPIVTSPPAVTPLPPELDETFAWEQSKENVLPIKRGRRLKTFEEAQSLSEEEIETRRLLFEDEMEDYEGDDPLSVWIRYISWTLDQFPSNDNNAGLLPLLRRCIASFLPTPSLRVNSDEKPENVQEGQRKAALTASLFSVPDAGKRATYFEKYRVDERFLSVWLMLADAQRDPSDLFGMLRRSDIGQDLARFYISAAELLERKGKFSAVEKILARGIERRAGPPDEYERLVVYHESFCHRLHDIVEKQRLGKVETPTIPAGEVVLNNGRTYSRHAFGSLESASGRSAPRLTTLGPSGRVKLNPQGAVSSQVQRPVHVYTTEEPEGVEQTPWSSRNVPSAPVIAPSVRTENQPVPSRWDSTNALRGEDGERRQHRVPQSGGFSVYSDSS